MEQHPRASSEPSDQAEIRVSRSESPRARLVRPRDVPRPESVDEVSMWPGSEDLRSTVLVYAPAFWVALPLAALCFLIQQPLTDPTGAGWSITINGESRDSWPGGVPWLASIGVSVWLLIAVGVLLLRLSVLRDRRAENEWIYTRGVAHSIHRASVDLDDGEASRAT